MRWAAQSLHADSGDALPGLARLDSLVRTVRTPEFSGVTFHEVLARSALNRVPPQSAMPFRWTINPMRGCLHRCTYCFARSTHEYLGFDAGADFDNEIVVKVNVADVLGKELSRASWQRERVALGTNTDPYQRAEGRYGLMPGIISALAASGTPLSILMKGTLLRRDLPLLAEASQRAPVDIAMSIAVFDDDLQQAVEPGTPSTDARLATVRAVREHGLNCTVFLMPILPWLTDSAEQLDHALARIAESGATDVVYGALHLRPGAREWFFAWLEREHPELAGRYRTLYARGANAPLEYRQQLSSRIRPLLRRHSLHTQREGARKIEHESHRVGSVAALNQHLEASLIAAALPSTLSSRALPQPTLF